MNKKLCLAMALIMIFSSLDFVKVFAAENDNYSLIVRDEIVSGSAAEGDNFMPPDGMPPDGMPPDMKEEQADESAPVIVSQPKAVHYVIEGSKYAAPKFAVSAKLPDTVASGSAFFEWYINDESIGTIEEYEISDTYVCTSSLNAVQLLNKPCGVYRVYCKVFCYADESEHSVNSYESAFIVCKGIKENCFVTFSDVHQTFSNISQTIEDCIINNNGYIPSLAVCSGDWVNRVHYMGENNEFYQKTADELIYRMSLQLGGIDTVYVSGNHDNGKAAAEATIAAGFGAEDDYDGVGIIYVGKDLVVIGMNYENAVTVDTDSRVISADNSSVIPELKAALEKAKREHPDKIVVISAHSGLHVLGIQPESAQSGVKEWSGSFEYNIDNSDKIVELLNEYSEYMDIIYFFGHDHSKGESEFVLLPGDTIISTSSYDEKTYSEHTLGFTYGHAGYLTDSIRGNENYSFVSWDKDYITRTMYKADGNQSKSSELTVSVKRKTQKTVIEETKRTSGGSSSKKAMRAKTENTPEISKTAADKSSFEFSFKNIKNYERKKLSETASQNSFIKFIFSALLHIEM
ncbi:MAG: metallophosphoesterase [Firmicutes bacterium]|nr:metallophosphoesterase [Bacillota bacterium]